MSVGFRKVLSVILILVLTASAVPAFAAKNSKSAAIENLSCDRDYGFSYKKAVSKGASKNAVVDVLKLIGGSIGKKLVDGAVDWALGDFINSIFGNESVNVEEKFNEVNGKLDEIKRLLDEMYQKIVVADFRGTIQNRDQKYNELKPEVVSRINSLLNANSAEERKKIIRDWADRSMMSASSGITATTQWGNLITTTFGGYTYIQCYDGYARLAFPWERDGYDFREAAREADLTLYIDACVLTGLYYNLVISGEIEGKSASSENYNIEAFKRQMNSVVDYFSKPENTVVRSDNRNQCQITGLTDFAVYVNDTYTGYAWSDYEGYNRYFEDLMKDFYVMGARTRRSVPLKSARLKKLLEYYQGLSVRQILNEKIGVKGIDDYGHSVILIDQEYKKISNMQFYQSFQIAVQSIACEDRDFSSISFAPVGICKAVSPWDSTRFLRWEEQNNNRTHFYIICTDDTSDGVPNSDDLVDLSGTITNVTKTDVTLHTSDDLDVTMDITSAVIEGTLEVGLEADVIYHTADDGSCIAHRIRVKMPVTLLEEQTLSGVVTKRKDKTLTVKGDNGEKYTFELNFNTQSLTDIPKNTAVTVTYQQGDDGKLYITKLENIKYEAPIFTADKLSMEIGDTQKLSKLTKVPGTWIIQDETIAKIVKGQKLKAVGAGETNLIFTVGTLAKGATYKGETVYTGDILMIPVTVTEKGLKIESLAIKPKKAEIKVSETIKLTATWKPKTATETTLTWTSSDESVATVDQTGLVTGLAVGKSVITVTAESGVSKSRNVIVKK